MLRRQCRVLGERPVDAGAGHLEDVGGAAHAVVVRVEHLGDGAADLGDVVEGDPLVAVDDHPDDAAAARRGDDELLEVVAGAADDGARSSRPAARWRGRALGAARGGHGFLLQARAAARCGAQRPSGSGAAGPPALVGPGFEGKRSGYRPAAAAGTAHRSRTGGARGTGGTRVPPRDARRDAGRALGSTSDPRRPG